MKFDLLVSSLLEENKKKLYKVTFLKYGIHGEYTRANDRDKAIENVARKHKKNVKEFQGINGAVAKLVEEGFEKEKKEGLHGWFSRNHGKGWVNCKKSKPGHIVPCGRKKGTKSGKGYPACRPTLSMCSGSKNKKKGHKTIKWKKKS
jgi:hypothetical protein